MPVWISVHDMVLKLSTEALNCSIIQCPDEDAVGKSRRITSFISQGNENSYPVVNSSTI
jgi:hypothetical protein